MDTMIVSSGIRLLFLASIVALFDLAGKILLAFAVYNDARSKSNRDALMWALLVGFIGLIPGIVYLCIRNSVRNYVVCQTCGCSHLVTDPNCPQCGAQNLYFTQYQNPMAGQQARQAKTFLTIGLFLLALALIFIIAIVAVAISSFLIPFAMIN